MFCSNPLLGGNCSHSFRICSKNGRSGDPFKIKWRPNGVQNIVMHSLLMLSKNAYISRNAEWTEPLFFLYFSFLYFPTLAAHVKKYVIVSFVSVAPNTSRNTKRVGPPKSNGRQRGSQRKTGGSIRSAFLDVFGFSDFSGIIVNKCLIFLFLR